MTSLALLRTYRQVSIIGAVSIVAMIALSLLLIRSKETAALVDVWIHVDRATFAIVNGYAGRSKAVDTLVWAIADDYALQGGIMVALFWWAWFTTSPDTKSGQMRRQMVLSSFAALFITVVLAILIRHEAPFRSRPLNDPTFNVPYLLNGAAIGSPSSSSFPSGHAAVFFALAAGLLAISPALGLVGILHATFIDCLPRIYLGFHYPSDILAGAILGFTVVTLANALLCRTSCLARLVSWAQAHPAPFYSVFLLASVEIGTGFASVGRLLRLLGTDV